MDDKKNYFIAALVVLLLISAVWGQKETGQRRKLIKENEALEAKLQAAGDAATDNALLRSEVEREKASKEQAAAQLRNAQEKLDELRGKLAALEAKKGEQEQNAVALQAEKEKMLAALKVEQEQATAALKADLAQKLAALKADRDKAAAAAAAAQKELAAACEAKTTAQAGQLTAAQQQLAQQQAVLEGQEQKLASAAAVIKQEQQQVKDCAGKLADQDKLQADLDELEAAAKQLEEERNKILDEAETLRAQVIGLERIVEERSTALDKTGKELDSCKVNTSVLIARISDMESSKTGTKPQSKAGQALPQK